MKSYYGSNGYYYGIFIPEDWGLSANDALVAFILGSVIVGLVKKAAIGFVPIGISWLIRTCENVAVAKDIPNAPPAITNYKNILHYT